MILDHSDTGLRLGLPEDVEAQHTELDDGKKAKSAAKDPEEPMPKACPSCAFLKPPKVHACPACGFAPQKAHEGEEVDVGLSEIKRKRNREHTPEQKGRFYAELLGYVSEKGYKPGWAANQYRERFGVWPDKYKDVQAKSPSPETRNWIKSRQIAFAKGKQKAAS